jgi:hypothetical protein
VATPKAASVGGDSGVPGAAPFPGSPNSRAGQQGFQRQTMRQQQGRGLSRIIRNMGESLATRAGFGAVLQCSVHCPVSFV